MLIGSFLIGLALIFNTWRENESKLRAMSAVSGWVRVPILTAPRDIDLMRTLEPIEREVDRLAGLLQQAYFDAPSSVPGSVQGTGAPATLCNPEAITALGSTKSPDKLREEVWPKFGMQPAPRVPPLPPADPEYGVHRWVSRRVHIVPPVKVQNCTDYERLALRVGPHLRGVYESLQPKPAVAPESLQPAAVVAPPSSSAGAGDGAHDEQGGANDTAVGKAEQRSIPGIRAAFVYAAFATTHESLAASSPTVYLGYPATELDSSYTAASRPWYVEAVRQYLRVSGALPAPLNQRKELTAWTTTYTDPGTGDAVVTCARTIPGSSGQPIGVVAIDLDSKALIHSVARGLPIVLNFLFLFALCMLLGGILQASETWDVFRHLYYAVMVWYITYVLRLAFWATGWDQSEIAREVLAVASFTQAFSLLIAAWLTFGHREITGASPWARLVRAIEHAVTSKPGLSGIFEGAFAAFLLWIVGMVASVLGLSMGIAPWGGEADVSIPEMLDAVVSCLAIIVFGYRLRNWTRTFIGAAYTEVGLALFLAYGGIQLAYPALQHRAWLWWLVLWAKVATFGLVTIVVYIWTETRNREKLAIASIPLNLLDAHSKTQAIVASRGPEQILFCSRELANRLGWEEEKDFTSVPHLDVGDFVRPARDRVTLSSIFIPKERTELLGRVLAEPIDEKGRRTFDGFSTNLRRMRRTQGDAKADVEPETVSVELSVSLWKVFDEELRKDVSYSVGFVKFV